MGRLGAEAMAEQDIPLETALSWHLGSNHYPPVPQSMIKVCVEAIKVANQDGPWDAEIKLPEGIRYKNKTTAPVGAIIEQHHLEAWIDDDGEL